jgi:hypothetical protein
MRKSFRLIDPAGPVQARQFAPMEVGPVFARIDLQPRFRIGRQGRIHCPVDKRAGVDRQRQNSERNDAEDRRNEADCDEPAADIACFVRSWRKVVLPHCAQASIRCEIRFVQRDASEDVQPIASRDENVSSAIIPDLAPADGATSQY